MGPMQEWLARHRQHAFAVPERHRDPQARVVRSRVRQLVPIIAGLTLAWIPFDIAGLTPGEFAVVEPVRLALAVALFLLWRATPRLGATSAAFGLVALQTFGFGVIEMALEGDAGLLGYGLFPFVIASQLAVLPMPWTRILALGVMPIGLLCAQMVINGPGSDRELWNDAWLLGVILALSAWGGHMQMLLLTRLLDARHDSLRDALTGLANRRSAEARLGMLIAQARRRDEPLSVVTLDLDHFKRVNDTWGHACGDLVLAATGAVLLAEIRSSDVAARFGGEEFLMVLPFTNEAYALHVAERVRERIAHMSVDSPDGPIRVTASLGIATLGPDESMESMLERADAALYRAKREGRNRCVASEAPRDTAPAR